MLDLSKYQSIGAALNDALDKFADDTCLIESDREREKERLTYRDFRERALRLARALLDAGFNAGDRTAIIMTNQSKWLISAYAILYCGGVMVPLDYKLTPDEQWQLLSHSNAAILITEYPIWRQLAAASRRAAAIHVKTVLVTEAPPNAALDGAQRWEDFHRRGEPALVARKRADVASIVYSSGTGGRPKGCMTTHENYLEQGHAIAQIIAFEPGIRYLSILPTNHVVDFMMGFFLPFTSGATVVHLRTLRPEFVRDAFARYKIAYMMLVPLILKNLKKGMETNFAALPKGKRTALNALIRVANAYGLTEAGTAVSVNDPRTPRADTVGKPLPGTEVRIVNPDADGIGELAVRGKTVMAGYLDDPELTAETIVDGWLMTGDLGRFDATGHLQLFGRKKNMIVTEEAKNIYPEDIETVFEGLSVKEFCVFAANYIWPRRSLVGEQLVLVLRLEQGQALTDELRRDISARNNRLLNYKRVHGIVLFDEDFPRTASLKIKRNILAERLAQLDRATAILPL